MTCLTTWNGYEGHFRQTVHDFTQTGIRAGVTGDTEFGRQWLQRICAAEGLEAWLPLWEVNAAEAFRAFLRLGFKALVVAASDSKVGEQLAGRTLDEAMVAELEGKHVDVLGEYNEYHTFVTDGPLFRHPVAITLGERRLHHGYWLQEIQPATEEAT